jgi:hypothetical protein
MKKDSKNPIRSNHNKIFFFPSELGLNSEVAVCVFIVQINGSSLPYILLRISYLILSILISVCKKRVF